MYFLLSADTSLSPLCPCAYLIVQNSISHAHALKIHLLLTETFLLKKCKAFRLVFVQSTRTLSSDIALKKHSASPFTVAATTVTVYIGYF